MGNANYSKIINSNTQIPGPRLNPQLVDMENLKQVDKNLLLREYQESLRVFDEIMKMQFKGEIKNDAPIAFIKPHESSQYRDTHQTVMYQRMMTVNDKEVSYELLYNMLGKRFHECLKKESENKELQKLSDRELVHQVCRKERLTFFNFLRQNTIDGLAITEEGIKSMLNREYAFYFHRDYKLDIYKEDVFFIRPTMNELNRSFNVNFT